MGGADVLNPFQNHRGDDEEEEVAETPSAPPPAEEAEGAAASRSTPPTSPSTRPSRGNAGESSRQRQALRGVDTQHSQLEAGRRGRLRVPGLAAEWSWSRLRESR